MHIDLNTIRLNNNPIDYVADEKLIKAVEIAIALGKPLLVSGEPGTGKTKLADYVSAQLALQTTGQTNSFLDKPFMFNTKSTSVANDLFYTYDAVSHFRSQQQNLPTEAFIELRALGLAIAQTHGRDSTALTPFRQLGNFTTGISDASPRSSVVLIDEIDKAPREFPNDLLNEIEHYGFDMRELNAGLRKAGNDARIIIIMTSNSEKNLPNAFLRRCVFYHIEFPDKEKLKAIARLRLRMQDPQYNDLLDKAIDEFNRIRNLAVNKKPSTSEFLDWMNVLEHFKLLGYSHFPPQAGDEVYDLFDSTRSTLIKSLDDKTMISNKQTNT